MCRGRNEIGFTVLELAITMTLTGIMLAMSIPAVGLLVQSNNLNAATQQMAGHLRLARQMAAATGFPHFVVWTDGGIHYSIVEDTNGDDFPGNGEPHLGPYALPDNVWWNHIRSELTGDPLRFLPDGSASESGLVTLENDRGKTASLQLIGSTGQIRLCK